MFNSKDNMLNFIKNFLNLCKQHVTCCRNGSKLVNGVLSPIGLDVCPKATKLDFLRVFYLSSIALDYDSLCLDLS